MDYSYVPQMYQQGVQHNLDKQFQLANQAQPVTQFLASLRQAKQMELQQQMEEDRQRRMDMQEAQQRAQNQMAFMSHISTELTPENAQSYRDLSTSTFGSDLVPAATTERKDLAGPPTPDGVRPFQEIIKQPTGSRMQLQQDQLAAKERMAQEKIAANKMIQDAHDQIKRDRLEWQKDSTSTYGAPKLAAAAVYEGKLKEIQDFLDAGGPAARVAEMKARASMEYQHASLYAKQTTIAGEYTPGMAGRDDAAADRAMYNGGVRIDVNPGSKSTVTPIPRRVPTVGGAGRPAPAAPAVVGEPAPGTLGKSPNAATNPILSKAAWFPLGAIEADGKNSGPGWYVKEAGKPKRVE